MVYRITRTSVSDSLSFDAFKIVNGREEDMGVIGCRTAASGRQLTCPIAHGVWRFTIRGDSLVGDLRVANDVKFRDVRTARSH